MLRNPYYSDNIVKLPSIHGKNMLMNVSAAAANNLTINITDVENTVDVPNSGPIMPQVVWYVIVALIVVCSTPFVYGYCVKLFRRTTGLMLIEQAINNGATLTIRNGKAKSTAPILPSCSNLEAVENGENMQLRVRSNASVKEREQDESTSIDVVLDGDNRTVKVTQWARV